MTLTRIALAAALAASSVAAAAVTLLPARDDSVAPTRMAAVTQPTLATSTSSACRKPAPTTAAGYQAMFDAKNDSGWSGGDQAASLRLPDGRTLWMFADTFQGTQTRAGGYAHGSRMVHNSFVIQDKGCLSAVNGRRRGQVIANATNGDFYWPQAATIENGKLVVLAARVHKTGGGSMDFASSGTAAAVFSLPRHAAPKLERMAPLPSARTTGAAPQYGAAVTSDGRYEYVYGSARGTDFLVFGRSVTVARVPVGRLLDLTSWRYWTGSTWSSSRTAAKRIVTAAPAGWSTSFTVFRRPDGAFAYLTKENDFVGEDIITGAAATPVGPFPKARVASYPSERHQGEVFYTALAHPEQKMAGGRMLVTICRNNTQLATVLGHADLYKPQFLTVPVS